METLLWVHSLVKQKNFLVLKDHVKLLPTTFDTINDFNLDKNKKYKLGLVYHQTKNQNIPFYQKSSEKIDISDNIQKKYKRFSKELITLVKNYNIQTLDLLTCDTEPIDNIDDLEIRYSLDKTGNENGPSTNWVLESHGVNIKDEYFSNTDKFTEVLFSWNIDFLNTYFKKTDEDVIIPGTTDISDTRFTNYIIKESFEIDKHNKDYFPIELFSRGVTDTAGQTGTGKLALSSSLSPNTVNEDDIKTQEYHKSHHLIIDGGGINYLGDPSPTITIKDVPDFPGLFSTKNYDKDSERSGEGSDNHIFTETGLGGNKLIIKNLNIDITGSFLQEGGGWIGAENFCHGGCYGQKRRVEGVMERDQTYTGYTQKARENAQKREPGSDISENDYEGTPFQCRTDPSYNKVDITNVGQYPWTNSAIIESCHLKSDDDYHDGTDASGNNSRLEGGSTGGVIVGANAGTYGGIIHVIGNLIEFPLCRVNKLIGKFQQSEINFWILRGYWIPLVKDIEGFYHINAYGTDPSLNDPSADLVSEAKKYFMCDSAVDDTGQHFWDSESTGSDTFKVGRDRSLWRNVLYPEFWPIQHVVSVSGDKQFANVDTLFHDGSLNTTMFPNIWWQIFTNLPSSILPDQYWWSTDGPGGNIDINDNNNGFIKHFHRTWKLYGDRNGNTTGRLNISDNDRNLKMYVPGFDTPYKAPSEYLVRDVIVRSNIIIRFSTGWVEVGTDSEDGRPSAFSEKYAISNGFIVEPPPEIFIEKKHINDVLTGNIIHIRNLVGSADTSNDPSRNQHSAVEKTSYIGDIITNSTPNTDIIRTPCFIDYSGQRFQDRTFNKLSYNGSKIIGDGIINPSVEKNSQFIKFTVFNNILLNTGEDLEVQAQIQGGDLEPFASRNRLFMKDTYDAACGDPYCSLSPAWWALRKKENNEPAKFQADFNARVGEYRPECREGSPTDRCQYEGGDKGVANNPDQYGDNNPETRNGINQDIGLEEPTPGASENTRRYLYPTSGHSNYLEYSTAGPFSGIRGIEVKVPTNTGGSDVWNIGLTNIFTEFINSSNPELPSNIPPEFTRNLFFSAWFKLKDSNNYYNKVPIDFIQDLSKGAQSIDPTYVEIEAGGSSGQPVFLDGKSIQDFIKIEYYCRCNNGIPGNKKNIYPYKFNEINLKKYHEIIGDKNKFINYSLNHTNFENILKIFNKLGTILATISLPKDKLTNGVLNLWTDAGQGRTRSAGWGSTGGKLATSSTDEEMQITNVISNQYTDFLYLIENSIEKIPMGGLGRLDFSANSYIKSTAQILIPDISGGINGFGDLDMFKARVQYVGTNSKNHFNEMDDGSTDNIFNDMKKHQDKILEKITDFSTNIQQFITWCKENSFHSQNGVSGDLWSNITSSTDDYLNMPWEQWGVTSPVGSFINSSNEIDVSNVTTQQYKAIIYELTYLVNKEKYDDVSGINRTQYKAAYFNIIASSANGYGTDSFLDLPFQVLNNNNFQELKKTIITIFLMIKHRSQFHLSPVDFII
tara:strand:- start:1020 stop:5546 length:4527 start_codon:yes stop_codon:yes gene_type:complete